MTRIVTNNTYNIAINGTTIWLTLAILLTPPISTSATHTVSTRDAITADHEYCHKSGIVTQCEFFSHSTLYIVEGSAKAVSVFSYNTVFDS